jgi:quercetin dioxygenase-like cupin family protein
MTCGFLALRPGEHTEPRRMIPSLIAYIIGGSGECIQDRAKVPLSAGDVVIIPSYTMYQFVSHPSDGLRAWLPQIRLWHGQGLLRRDLTPGGSSSNDSEAIEDSKVADLFQSRRENRNPAVGKTRYDWFLSRLAEESRVEREAPRVIRGKDCSWEATRQGKLKFYISRWTEVAARGLDLMAQEIGPGERSGEHRHIFEELLLVTQGGGYDLHEGTQHRWEEGDLICIPPMTAHQHVNDEKAPAQLVSVWPRQPGHELLGGIEQLSNASDWKAQP